MLLILFFVGVFQRNIPSVSLRILTRQLMLPQGFEPRTPEGCETVAGGRSVSGDHRSRRQTTRTLKECQILVTSPKAFLHPFRVPAQIDYVPVVFAALRPPATLSQPSGLPLMSQI